jgi:hypothetical protein
LAAQSEAGAEKSPPTQARPPLPAVPQEKYILLFQQLTEMVGTTPIFSRGEKEIRDIGLVFVVRMDSPFSAQTAGAKCLIFMAGAPSF